MTAKEFILACHNCGICRKSRAERYIEGKPADYKYAETDFENVFDFDDILTEGEKDWAQYRSGSDAARQAPDNYWTEHADHVQLRLKKE